MAGITYFAKRVTLINISKTSPAHFPNCFQSATGFSRASCLSTANQPAQSQGSNAVAESTSDSMYEAKQQSLDMDEGRARGGPVTDTVKDRVKKAVDIGEDDHDDHIDKDPAVLEMKKSEDPIDTQEYRSMEDPRMKDDGHDKAAD